MNDDPLAYFITWTTYGTWLPGDGRWWVLPGKGHQPPSPFLEKCAAALMAESSITLTMAQRELCDATIRKHCAIRKWNILALNCRTNHIHLVVEAPQVEPKVVAKQLKAWCTRRLKEMQVANGVAEVRENWWTEGESKHQLYTTKCVDAAIIYVIEGQ